MKICFQGRVIKKSDLILGFLFIIFFIVLVAFIFDSTLHESFLTGIDFPQSTIIDIKDHEMESITHFAGSKTCSACHSDQINNNTICILLCHKAGGIANSYIPVPTWIGMNDSGTILFQHHPEGTLSFGCLSANCHENPVKPDDARYVIMQDTNHEYCDICHDFSGHGNDSGGMGGGKHRTHIIYNNKGPDPPLDCTHCHGAFSPPLFADGENLENTIVCDDCHSPDGSYNGVDSVGESVGAKDNWASGVYSSPTLQPGKEKWCAGCHDEISSIINNISAPNVIGDEDILYNYGNGYGYFKTGHGLSTNDKYPSSGDVVSGAGLNCDACHDNSFKHIDGDSRTYTYTASIGSDNDYQHGYRLKSINGDLPMVIPRTGDCITSGVNSSDFRLCMSCHNNEPFTNSSNNNTNFRHTGTPDFNAHYYHLAIKDICDFGPIFSSDWSYLTWDSRASCVTCHNVHGSTQLSMVRDGELIDKEPGLELAYYNDNVSYQCGGPGEHPPTPSNVTLLESTGTVWNEGGIVSINFCANCHGSCGYDSLYNRNLFDVTSPEITAVFGKNNSNILAVFFSEGVYTEEGANGSLLISDFILINITNSISGTIHTAGSDFAQLILNSNLSNQDIGVGELSAATIDSIYDWKDNAMDPALVTIIEDSIPPTISNQVPGDTDIDIPIDNDISFSLSDSKSGVDFTSFIIQLTGDKGYNKTYSDSNISIISKTGTPNDYNILVNPDIDFDNNENITVSINVRDFVGNIMSEVTWTFTTIASSGNPQTIIIHPSELNTESGGWGTVGGNWTDILDSNDNDSSYAVLCCTSPNWFFYVDMDNPTGIEGATIDSIVVYVYARYLDGPSPSANPYAGGIDIGYKTGNATIWNGSTTTDTSGLYNLIQTISYSSDSDGGPLDLIDINNIQISVKRIASGSPQIRVSEVFIEVSYVL
jgi:hypothetical protein